MSGSARIPWPAAASKEKTGQKFSMNPSRAYLQLAKFLVYVLGRRPDEFALVPDAQGTVAIRDLLHVLTEEPGWRHIRAGHLKTIPLHLSPAPVKMDAKRIWAQDRSHLPMIVPDPTPPKLLYTCVRRRAHVVVADRGLAPADGRHIILSAIAETALRLGRRSDANPVLITVQTAKAMAAGLVFSRFGQLHVCDRPIARQWLGVPPLPKEKPDSHPATAPCPLPDHAGSFFLDPDRLTGKQTEKGRKGEPAWKQERRRHRKR
jgi:putative RNA 2'-phosphotransferase